MKGKFTIRKKSRKEYKFLMTIRVISYTITILSLLSSPLPNPSIEDDKLLRF